MFRTHTYLLFKKSNENLVLYFNILHEKIKHKKLQWESINSKFCEKNKYYKLTFWV